MSKVSGGGKGARFSKGGGAGRHPGGDGERVAPTFLGLLFGGSDKAPANIGTRRSGTAPKGGRGKGTARDTSGPRGRKH